MFLFCGIHRFFQLLANMEFRPTDHATEKQLKLDVIAVYNHRLDEREKRKRFVVEHNLLDYKKQPCGSKKRLKVCLTVDLYQYTARVLPFAWCVVLFCVVIYFLFFFSKVRVTLSAVDLWRA